MGDLAGVSKGESETMTANVGATWHFTSAFIGATILVVALAAPGSAQQPDPSARTAKPDQGATVRSAAKPAKPVAAQTAKTSVKTNAKVPAAQGRPWTLEDAMPDHSASMRQYDPRPASPGIGRVPLQSGTVGFETKTQVNPNQTPDGATIRGQEATAARSSSYLGMSLSVPTDNKAMSFPLPWAKP
jgi:hypothetical protein